jgi:AcrR family transcriptional regulator
LEEKSKYLKSIEKQEKCANATFDRYERYVLVVIRDSISKGYSGWEERSVDRALEASRRRAAERSRRLVRAAVEIVDKEGLEGLTIQSVIARTGLSLRAFYQRFASKDDLLVAVFEEGIRGAAEVTRAQIADLEDPVERLRAIVAGMFPTSGSSAVLAMMSREHHRLAESHPEELRYALAPLESLIAENLAAGMESGQVYRADPEQLAVLVLNMVSATVTDAVLTKRSSGELEQRGDELWRFCWRALEAR